MKGLKMGLLCVVFSTIAGQVVAAPGGKGSGNGNAYGYGYGNGHNNPVASVPEPGSLSLLAAGILAIAAIRRFKK